MTRVGVGLKVLAPLVGTMLVAGILTMLSPGAFTIRFLSPSVLRIVGLVLLAGGATLKIASSRVPATAFNSGELVTTGVFSLIRHPMYAAWIWFLAPAIALLAGSWLMLAGSVVGYCGFRLFIKEEEDYLERKFGSAYLDYRARVGELFPAFKRRL